MARTFEDRLRRLASWVGEVLGRDDPEDAEGAEGVAIVGALGSAVPPPRVPGADDGPGNGGGDVEVAEVPGELVGVEVSSAPEECDPGELVGVDVTSGSREETAGPPETGADRGDRRGFSRYRAPQLGHWTRGFAMVETSEGISMEVPQFLQRRLTGRARGKADILPGPEARRPAVSGPVR